MQIKSSSYKDSGVDIKKADQFISQIKPLAKATYRPEVLAGLGGFGALFHIDFQKYKDPVIVSSTDGVGTKLKIAFMANRHDTIGLDLVAMSVNDILTLGAEPLFFLDYFATANLELSQATQVVKGISEGCKISNCSLIGGETAEMPGIYHKGEYDLAGFAVGVVERNKVIDGSAIKVGHKLVGLSSSGLHSNGYSLVRKIFFEQLKLKPTDTVKELKGKVSDILLAPTIIYVPLILPLLKRFSIHGMVHVTGGGLTENIPRVIPKGLAVQIKKGSWEIPPIFSFLQSKGKIKETEMLSTFNCGIGFILIVPDNEAQDVVSTLNNLKQKASVIGEVISKKGEDVVYKS
ncbi:MAG: phosphoribosylformylglycinamidine cyclo-ligase [Deltaproteobacteria bacterium]|nr:phosphoribosylformylglycinamidine cyclo-ligase [Deltaproteobacteria bacterium]